MKGILAFAIACALPIGILAEEMPVFDGGNLFDVIGTFDGDQVIVASGGDSFVCELDLSTEGFAVLKTCLPIITEMYMQDFGPSSISEQLVAAIADSNRNLLAETPPNLEQVLIDLGAASPEVIQFVVQNSVESLGCLAEGQVMCDMSDPTVPLGDHCFRPNERENALQLALINSLGLDGLWQQNGITRDFERSFFGLLEPALQVLVSNGDVVRDRELMIMYSKECRP